MIEILEKGERSSMEEIFSCINIVEQRKDILILKVDGARDENKYSVIVSSPGMKFEAIRRDGASIKLVLIEALKSYFKIVALT